MTIIVKKYKMHMLMFAYCIITLPFYFSQVGNGLDPSWAYALNKFINFQNIKFGKDIVFTYGLLGFLGAPMTINNCYIYAGLVFAFFYASSIILFYRLAKDGDDFCIPLISLLVFFFASPAGVDGYIQYCVLLSLTELWRNTKDKFAAIFFIISITIAFFYKFSITVPILAVSVLFVIAKALNKQYCRLWVFALPIILVPFVYFVYNPSIKDFFNYIKGSWEVAKGYSVAMSTFQYNTHAFGVFVLIGLYICIFVSQLINHEYKNVYAMIWFSPALFISYKHGYVRADGHVNGGYSEMLMCLSLLVMALETRELKVNLLKKNRKAILTGFCLLAFVTSSILFYEEGIRSFERTKEKARNITHTIARFEQINRNNLDSLGVIPESFQKIIGDKTYTSYPWEITFIENSKGITKNFIPLPVLQIYSTYTPYLDEMTANFFSNQSGPDYIIFNFDTIDGRIPLIEVPATWKAIVVNYRLRLYDPVSNTYLLVKSDKKEEDKALHIRTEEIDKNSLIITDDCSEIKIHAKNSLTGKIINVLWKTFDVNARITYKDGMVKEGRVLLDNLADGIIVNGLPYDCTTLYDLINKNGDKSRIASIQLYGNGLKFYSDTITVEYIDYE